MLAVRKSYSHLTFPLRNFVCITSLIKGTSVLTGSSCTMLWIFVCGEKGQNSVKTQSQCFCALTTYICNALEQTLFASCPRKWVLDLCWRLCEDLIITVKIGSVSVPFRLLNAFVTEKGKIKTQLAKVSVLNSHYVQVYRDSVSKEY